MKTKIDLKLTLSLSRKASKKEVRELIEICAYLLDVQGLYGVGINPCNQQLPLKVEHHFVGRLKKC